MEEYIKWLENKIEVCLEDKDLQREHWAFCQALKKYRELALRQPLVSNRYTLQDMIDAYDAGVWNPNDETAKEYMKRKYNVC
jgi:hypothetical protein